MRGARTGRPHLEPICVDPAQAQQVLEKFVKFLCDRRDVIAEEWAASIHRNGRLQTPEMLTAEELRQHLPALFDNLADVLRTPANRTIQNQADENARVFGRQRFGQHFRLDELVREIAVIRTALITQEAAFADQTPDFQGMVRRVALQRLHGFFDNMLADAAAQFTQEQQGGLRQDLATARKNTDRERGERVDAQTELRDAESASEQFREVDSARLRLLRTVAHEVRNSLNASHLTMDALQEEDNAGARKELISMLKRNNDHMEALIKNLLNYTILLEEPKFARMEAVSIPELYEDMVSMYRPLAEAKGLEMIAEADPAFTSVISHRTKLVQIMSNLLSNGIKYTASGTVHLSIRSIDKAHWSVIVEDTGLGIAPDEIEQVFTEFHRAPKTAHIEGTGLGLALVRRLTDLLGGEVRVTSEPGTGSRFEVVLPTEPTLTNPLPAVP